MNIIFFISDMKLMNTGHKIKATNIKRLSRPGISKNCLFHCTFVVLSYNRTRIAPTPSGYLHIGNVLSFAITAELARRSGASVLLRIDDVDRERTEKRYVQDIFNTLNFMEIPWGAGPSSLEEFEAGYSQMHRLPLYNSALLNLRNSGQLFACNCSRAQVAAAGTKGYPGTCRDRGIPLDAENVNWRLRTDDRQLSMKQLNGTHTVSQLPDEVRDFVVRKKDGFPGYQLSSLVDDLHFGIDMVVRGEDLWASTLAQLYLSALLPPNTFKDIVFHHHRLLTADSGEKLSKTAGDISVQFLRKEGKSKSDIYTAIGQTLGSDRHMNNYVELASLVLGTAG
jgi:glutamyl-tRNA synthetase